jgi:hypothetical protein
MHYTVYGHRQDLFAIQVFQLDCNCGTDLEVRPSEYIVSTGLSSGERLNTYSTTLLCVTACEASTLVLIRKIMIIILHVTASRETSTLF